MLHTRSALLLGYGYVAKATAPLLQAAGFQVVGTSRSIEKLDDMRALGVESLIDPATGDLREAMALASHILVSVPPGETGDPMLEALGGDVDLSGLDWLGYLSTTGVYGDAEGDWVTEETSPAPIALRSKQRLEAERTWQKLSDMTRVFRVSGIYGPNRSALDRVQAGTARRIVKPGQVFSRIHVDDIAAALMASIARPDVTGPFNLADDAPASQAEVTAFAAGLLGVDPPPLEVFETAEMSAMTRSFFSSSRRVSSAASQKALGWALKYPDYRAGLQAIYDASI